MKKSLKVLGKLSVLLIALVMLISLVPALAVTATKNQDQQLKVLFWHTDTDSEAVEYANYAIDFYSQIEGVTLVEKTSGALSASEL